MRERHRLKFKNEDQQIKEGQVVLINSEEKNRGKWSIGIVEKIIKGTDGITRGAVLKTRKTRIERAIELLYPLELDCDISEEIPVNISELNPQAKEFRPKRKAAKTASETVRETFEYENKELEDE